MSVPQSAVRTNAQLVDDIGTRAGQWAGRSRQQTGLAGLTAREIGTKQHTYVSGPPSAVGRIHGNSLASPRTAYLYRLEDAEGNLLKWGVTQDLNKRYTKSFLEGKNLVEVTSGTRADIIRIERGLVETQPGPLNFERWAGKRLGEQP